jgi:riboflavin biosynthesis pyrimidine reductase
MNGAFLNAGLVDEVSVIMCPAIDCSSGSSAIFEAGENGLSSDRNLSFCQQCTVPIILYTCDTGW